MINCHQCHPGGGGGLAPSINDKPLPEGLIKTQIRQGLGAMPAFTEKHLSDADVDGGRALSEIHARPAARRSRSRRPGETRDFRT
jgi:mono/diheme cytochrome c family protein